MNGRPPISERDLACLAMLFAQVAAEATEPPIMTPDLAYQIATALLDLQDLRRAAKEG